MTREQQLKFCKVCKNKGFDAQQGIICNLTGARADFQYECSSYHEDEELKNKEQENKVIRNIASQNKRLANYLLDLVFIILFSIGFGIFLAIVLSILAPSSLYLLDERSRLMGFFFNFIAGMIYFVTLESLTGRSVAKFITKTKVVDVNGNKPAFGVVLLRSLCRFIPFEALSFLGSDVSGWHDTISKTTVVNVD
jgi:uncharacterized RDD family membrane protein YckC